MMQALVRYLSTLRPIEWVVVLSIPVLTSILYVPFLGNELVFDDLNLLRAPGLAHFATTPFDLNPRTFPYFTLTAIDVLTGSIEVNRVVSLLLHVWCALLLFVFLRRLLQTALIDGENDAGLRLGHATTLSAVAALLFAIHPVAVYGAGYLVQRTIVFVTIFCLLSSLSFMKALRSRRLADVGAAALFFTAAAFSKQHAVTAPFAIATLAFVVGPGVWASRKIIAQYLALCLPAIALMVLNSVGVIGKSYEPDIDDALKGMEGLPEAAVGPYRWFYSAATQAGLFFRYLYYWVIPDISTMSADMRVDFAEIWSAWSITLRVGAFLVVPFLGLVLVMRKSYTRLLGLGMLYVWIMFLIELSTVRFQEPFVLYRSYLWAPGILLMMAAVIGSCLPSRGLTLVAVLMAPILIFLAQERLASLTDQLALWDDAAEKLPSGTVPGADRIYYNRGVEYMNRRQNELALVDMNRAIAANPKGLRGYLGRGSANLFNGDYSQALSDFDRALVIRPGFSQAHFNRGVSLERLGRIAEAEDAYRTAAKLGYPSAALRLGRIGHSTVIFESKAPTTPDPTETYSVRTK